MGMWGSVQVDFRIGLPDKPGDWMTEDQKSEVVHDFFESFYPFAACEGGMNFYVGTMFSPDILIRIRNEGELPTHEVLLAFAELFEKYDQLYNIEVACVSESWDSSSDEEIFYFSKEEETVLIEHKIYDKYAHFWDDRDDLTTE